MASHDWCWSDIVDPQLVKAALADEERRALRRRQRASNDSPADGAHERRPVAA